MAKDYSDIGLNQDLTAKNSLGNQGTYTTTMGFDAGFEGINASQITGGNIRTTLDVGNNSSSGSAPFIRFDGTADRVLYNDGTTNRFFFGNNNGTAAVKLSQAGNDVLTATDDKLIWSSDFNTFKIVQTGTISVSKGTNQYSGATTVTHNLGYFPVVLAYLVDADSGIQTTVPHSELKFSGSVAGAVYIYYNYSYFDTTKIDFNIYTPDVSGGAYADSISAVFRYYLMRETAT